LEFLLNAMVFNLKKQSSRRDAKVKDGVSRRQARKRNIWQLIEGEKSPFVNQKTARHGHRGELCNGISRDYCNCFYEKHLPNALNNFIGPLTQILLKIICFIIDVSL